MAMISFEKLLKIISTILSILSYAIGLISPDGTKPASDTDD